MLRELTFAKGRLSEALARIQLHACSHGCQITNLLPLHGRVMWVVAQDVLSLMLVRDLESSFFAKLEEHDEFETLTFDATVKVCLGIMGQSSASQIRKQPDSAAMPESDNLRRLLAVRGWSGCVLALRLLREERADLIAEQMSKFFTAEQRAQVKYIGVDNPPGMMHKCLQTVFPALVVLFLDVTHLAMNSEKKFGGNRSPSSRLLRRVLGKFNAVNARLCPATWCPSPFCGELSPPHTEEEARMNFSPTHLLVHALLTHKCTTC